MRIGIAGPFNPAMIKSYFTEDTYLPEINITATSVNLYVRGLLELGHEVTVFTSHSGQYREITGFGVKVYLISDQFKLRGFGRARMSKRIANEIEKEIENLDILHAEWTYEYACAVRKYRKRVPIFCSVRDWCPYLLTIVNGAINRYYWYMSYMLFRKTMGTREFHFIANSDYTYKQITGRYPENDVTIIYNPLLSKNILRERDYYPKEMVFISISQSLGNPRKNFLSLLKAFQLYRSKNTRAKLLLVGGYSQEWEDVNRAQGLLENVELLGNQTYDEVFRNLDSAKVLIHPSLEETFGNILLEAMCRRVLCVGGENAGAVPQVLGYGKYGLLCDVTDPNSIAEAMARAEDDNIRMKIVEESTKHIEKTYTEKTIAMMHISLFKKSL